MPGIPAGDEVENKKGIEIMSAEIGNAGEERKLHMPAIMLGLVVAVVFLVAIFSFQLKSTDYAVVSTFGKVSLVKEAGLHFRLPFPFQKVYFFDKRQRSFEGVVGKMEETYTADKKNIIIGIYVKYRIVDPIRLFNSERTIGRAENKLNSLMRSGKDEIVGKYKFSQFVNTDPEQMKLGRIESDIKNLLAGVAKDKFGIEILSVGIKSLELPRKVTEDVIKRMKAERETAAEVYLADGKRTAANIRTNADTKKKEMLAKATAKAKSIRAEGDAEAATYYAVFKKEPELAVFLRKLDALRNIVRTRTILVLDTDTAPFDLLEPGAEKLEK